MLVKIKGNPIVSDWPPFSDGQTADLPDYLALHLMEIDCATPMENKVMTPVIEKKSTAVTNASLSLPAAQVSQKSKSKKHGNFKPSQSTTTTK